MLRRIHDGLPILEKAPRPVNPGTPLTGLLVAHYEVHTLFKTGLLPYLANCGRPPVGIKVLAMPFRESPATRAGALDHEQLLSLEELNTGPLVGICGKET